jgi:hypothetical protein
LFLVRRSFGDRSQMRHAGLQSWLMFEALVASARL